MTLHMTISMVAPILLVLAAPIPLALRALKPRPDKTLGPREMVLGLVHSRFLRVLANPIVAAALFFGSLVVFYYSPLFELALRTHTGHVLMVIHFLLTGYLFAWVLIGVDPGPPKWSPSLRLLILFATISFHAFFGVALTDRHDAAGPELLRAAAAAVARPTCSSTSTTRARSPGASASCRPCSWRCWSPWPGSAPTRPRPGAWTARPTATATPSSRPTTRAWRRPRRATGRPRSSRGE